MIDVINVTKRFGKFTALENMSFSVGKSSIYGLVGYNGAGKTTLLKSAAGVYSVEEGEIRIAGENVFDNAKIKQKIFYVPDDLYFPMNASMDKMAKFYNGYYLNFSMETYEKLAKVFGLDTKNKLNGFSKGMQRQAELVLALATRPEVLYLTNPLTDLTRKKERWLKIWCLNTWRSRKFPLLFPRTTCTSSAICATTSDLSTATSLRSTARLMR